MNLNRYNTNSGNSRIFGVFSVLESSIKFHHNSKFPKVVSSAPPSQLIVSGCVMELCFEFYWIYNKVTIGSIIK
jgi:hypothetical protein